ncbi:MULTISPECIES: DUF2242 domain-containing protein [unclassified Pseudomonas]|uniref:DUF2242 domain-containing protein n=1 Tax=unclassified Pseudomonas TaxID=196821 RepID=UPI000C8810C9|nr:MULTISPECIES: DUF2242 domain-containing protein [unclassified Pseudomonas]PMZ87335.1 DUF2242 domain-containing protein [Pseudomonas sp. FW305-42]PNA19539.1 DUF2242 domain-containing protein [Pseudomonas sp. MPR-R1B]PNB19405.1 DUF2242 domain-containing protein [Pseudomonas sp. DP16D-E2]PNB40497.1 DUF2242 domain-containing protein [Pseudomonas sp. FW305-17]PNB55487.1 DUF2242 domain-containing protein [Pseudomonas sp. GW531-E2]
MSRSTVYGALGLALVLAGVSGCSSKKAAVYEHENFDDSGTFSRTFATSEAGSCEAARRALLSQGYIITSSDANQVAGNKSFQQNAENHLQISFNITCVPDMSDKQRSTMFANALQDRYALKKSNTSASLGVGVLGSVSMPIGSTDDSMVKVASETVTAAQFYDRYFALVESYLPKPKKPEKSEPAAEPKVEKPAADLGLPEPAPAALAPVPQPVTPVAESVAETPAPVSTPVAAAPAAAPAPVATPAPPVPSSEAPAAPVVDDSKGSQPIAPPVEPAPIQVQQEAPAAEQAPAPL